MNSLMKFTICIYKWWHLTQEHLTVRIRNTIKGNTMVFPWYPWTLTEILDIFIYYRTICEFCKGFDYVYHELIINLKITNTRCYVDNFVSWLISWLSKRKIFCRSLAVWHIQCDLLILHGIQFILLFVNSPLFPMGLEHFSCVCAFFFVFCFFLIYFWNKREFYEQF